MALTALASAMGLGGWRWPPPLALPACCRADLLSSLLTLPCPWLQMLTSIVAFSVVVEFEVRAAALPFRNRSVCATPCVPLNSAAGACRRQLPLPIVLPFLSALPAGLVKDQLHPLCWHLRLCGGSDFHGPLLSRRQSSTCRRGGVGWGGWEGVCALVAAERQTSKQCMQVVAAKGQASKQCVQAGVDQECQWRLWRVVPESSV